MARDPKGDVVDGTRSHMAGGRVGRAEKIDQRTGAAAPGGEAKSILLVTRGMKPHRLGEQSSGRLVSLQGERDAVKTADGGCLWNRAITPGTLGPGLWLSHQLQLQSVGIEQGQVLFLEAPTSLCNDDTLFLQAFGPVVQGPRGHGEGRDGRLAGAAATSKRPGPWEEGENRAGSSQFVPEIEMIGPRIVEVDGLLDQSQAQHLRVEIEIGLRIGSDRGDVVNSENGRGHEPGFYIPNVGTVPLLLLRKKRGCPHIC